MVSGVAIDEAIITAPPCPACRGTGSQMKEPTERRHGWSYTCPTCRGRGSVELPPAITDRAVDFPPGSLEKLQTLALRYDLGRPLWHEGDRVDHEGIGERMPDEVAAVVIDFDEFD
ncbi:MAG: hypothetical protein ACYTGL_13980 [Planctomycetota bacterium]